LVNLRNEQAMTGHLKGESIHTKLERDGEEMVAHIVEVDHNGRAHILEWSNGVILAREPFKEGRAKTWQDETQREEKSPIRRLEHPLENSEISIAGRWSSTIGRIYKIEQEGPRFSWRVEGLDELGEGRIENRHLLAKWHSRSGLQSAEGEAVEVTPEGQPMFTSPRQQEKYAEKSAGCYKKPQRTKSQLGRTRIA